MSRPKMVSVSGGGGGGPGQAGAEPAPRMRAGQRPGPGRTLARASRLSRSLHSLEEAPGVPGRRRLGYAGRRGEEVGVGTDPGRRAASLVKTVPSPLLAFHAPPPLCVVLGPEVLRGSSPRAWPGRGLSFCSLSGVTERSAPSLSFPSSFSYVHPAPSPQPRMSSRRRPSADGRDLIPPVAPLGRSLIAPSRRPFALLCAAGPGRERAVEPPSNPGQVTLFLFKPFLWLLGKNRGKGGAGAEETGRSSRRKAWARGGGSLLALSSSAWTTVCPWLSDDL